MTRRVGAGAEEEDRKEGGRRAFFGGGLSSFLSKYRVCQVNEVLIVSSLDEPQRCVKGQVREAGQQRMEKGLVMCPFRTHPEKHKTLMLGLFRLDPALTYVCNKGLVKSLGSFISQC